MLIIAAAVYINSFRGKFFFDDYQQIVHNRRVHQLWPPVELFRNLTERGMRPVALLSFAVNWQISGRDEWSYHLFNLIVHLLAGLLLFGVVRRTLLSERLRERFGAAAVPLAAAVALIWMVHPLQSQAVTYIVQRAESLMGLFYLLTLYCAIRALDARRRWAWYLPAVAACALGMGTKQVMVTAPLVVVIYDALFAPRPYRAVLRRRWGLYLALAATWGILAALYRHSPPLRSVGAATGISPYRYAISQFGVIAHYLRLAFWPSRLCLDYGWPAVEKLRQVLPQAILILLLLAGTVVALVKFRWLGFWGLWFFLILAPTSSILPIADLAAEHRMYLPLAAVVAVTVTAAYLLGRLLPGAALRRALGTVLLCAVVLVLSGLTIRRNSFYHDEVRMWGDVVRQNPKHYRGLDNLGVALSRAGKLDEAIARYRQAIRLKPSYASAYCNLGVALAKKPGKLDEAIACYIQAIRLRKDYAEAYCSLAAALTRQGKYAQAEAACRKALQLRPNYATAHGALAEVLERTNRPLQAEKHYLQVLRLQPDHPKRFDAHASAARLAAMRGDYRAAAEHYRAALKAKPDGHRAQNNLAWLLATCPDESLRNGDEAVRLALEACRTTRYQDPIALDTLAAAYAEAGRFDQATRTARRAVALAAKAGRSKMAKQFAARLRLYQSRQPFRTARPAAPTTTTAPTSASP